MFTSTYYYTPTRESSYEIKIDMQDLIRQSGYNPDELTGTQLQLLTQELLVVIRHNFSLMLKMYPQAKIPDTQQSIEHEN